MHIGILRVWIFSTLILAYPLSKPFGLCQDSCYPYMKNSSFCFFQTREHLTLDLCMSAPHKYHHVNKMFMLFLVQLFFFKFPILNEFYHFIYFNFFRPAKFQVQIFSYLSETKKGSLYAQILMQKRMI